MVRKTSRPGRNRIFGGNSQRLAHKRRRIPQKRPRAQRGGALRPEYAASVLMRLLGSVAIGVFGLQRPAQQTISEADECHR